MNDLGLQVLYEIWQRAPEMLQPFIDRPVLIPVLSDPHMGEDLEKIVPVMASTVDGSVVTQSLSYAMENAKISSGTLIAVVYVVKN